MNGYTRYIGRALCGVGVGMTVMSLLEAGMFYAALGTVPRMIQLLTVAGVAMVVVGVYFRRKRS